MDFKANEIKAGIMIVVSVVILGLFLIAIFGVKLGRETNPYRISLQYVGGITEGSLVKYRGMDVGQVSEIDLPGPEEPRIGVKIEVQKDTPIRIDSKAFITSVGLMTERHVEITSGSPHAELLPPGSLIQSKEVLSFAQMAETMGELSDRLQALITRVNRMFNDENQTHVASMMENMDNLIQEGRKPIITAVTNLESISGQLTAISENLYTLTDTTNGNVVKILSNLETTSRRANKLISDMNGTLDNFKTLMSANNASIGKIMENFQTASQNMEEFSHMIKEQPWLLVRKAAPPKREIE